MAKGLSANFKSYQETVPKILDVIGLPTELKKHSSIVLKPNLNSEYSDNNTPPEFVEAVLQYCLKHKNPVSEIFIAEGSDGKDTQDAFDSEGYTDLAEKYNVGLIDLNNTETSQTEKEEFISFKEIKYPKVLKDSFIISLPKLSHEPEHDINDSLTNMLGAYPSKHYKGLLTKRKTKIRKHPIANSISDIISCKLPNLGIIDASKFGKIIAGQPITIDKAALNLLDRDLDNVQHLKLLERRLG